MATENVCNKKRQSFANISLSRNCISDLISDVVADMDYQLMEKIVSFEVFSFGIDESTDITDFFSLQHSSMELMQA